MRKRYVIKGYVSKVSQDKKGFAVLNVSCPVRGEPGHGQRAYVVIRTMEPSVNFQKGDIVGANGPIIFSAGNEDGNVRLFTVLQAEEINLLEMI